MSETISYTGKQVIRKALAGSPHTSFNFSTEMLSVEVDNFESTAGIYVDFNATSVLADGSAVMYIDTQSAKGIDLKCSGIQIYGSGDSTHIVQVTGLR